MKKSNSRTTPPRWNVHQVTTSSADALVHSSALAALTTPTSKEQCYLRIRHVCQPSKKLWKAKMFHKWASGVESHICSPQTATEPISTLMQVHMHRLFSSIVLFFSEPQIH